MQIRIALSLEDEKKLIDSLAKYDLYCLPRFFLTNSPKILNLGGLLDRDQVIFSKEFKQEILYKIKPVLNNPLKFHVFPKNGNCIEWDRSITDESRELHTPGRFYFKPDLEENAEESEYLTKVYRFICREIKKNSFKSKDHTPIYVGKHLASLIEQDVCQLTYGSNTKVEFSKEGQA
jgi:hypothetical protein